MRIKVLWLKDIECFWSRAGIFFTSVEAAVIPVFARKSLEAIFRAVNLKMIPGVSTNDSSFCRYALSQLPRKASTPGFYPPLRAIPGATIIFRDLAEGFAAIEIARGVSSRGKVWLTSLDTSMRLENT